MYHFPVWKAWLKSQYFQAEKHHWVTAKGSTCFYLFYMGRHQKTTTDFSFIIRIIRAWWAALVQKLSKKKRSYKLTFGNKLWHWPLLGRDICLAFLMIILSSTGNKVTCRTSSLMSMIKFRMWKWYQLCSLLKLSCFLTTGIDGKKSWETIHRLLGIEYFGGEMLQNFRDIEIFISSEICNSFSWY